MTVTPLDLEVEAHRYLGLPYGFNDRCGQGWDLPIPGVRHELDCSGLWCKVMNRLGLTVGCINSFQFATLAWDHGLVIPLKMALEVPCFLIEGPNGGRGPSQEPNGADGHIGGAFVSYTIEERGHAYGCVTVAPIDLNRFDIACWFPGVDYVPPAPPALEEPNMIIQNNHYDAHGVATPIPSKDAQSHYHVARWIIAADGKTLLGYGGASIYGDGNPHTAGGPRVLAPRNLGGATIVGLARWDPKDGTIPGVYAQYSDGRGYPLRFS